MLDKLKSIFIVTVFIGGCIGAIIFHKTEPRIAIICIGAVFFIFGLFVLFSQKMSLKSIPILMFPVLGLLMIVIPALLMIAENSDELESEFVERLAVNCFLSVFVLVGIGLVALPPVIHRLKMKVFTVNIEAVCIRLDHHISRSSKGRRTITYAPTWEYDHNGNVYTYKESTYTNLSVPKVGAVYRLLMNPDKPEELYRPVKSVRILLFVIGAAFTVMGVLFLVSYNMLF